MKKYLIIIFSIVVFILLLCIYPFTYGQKGDLNIEINVDNNTIQFNKTFNLSIKIINEGKTKIRLLDPIYYLHINVKYNNQTDLSRPNIDDLNKPTLHDLKTLKPKDTIVINEPYFIDWNKYNPDYNIITIYAIFRGNYDDLILPHWKGSIESEKIIMSVL